VRKKGLLSDGAIAVILLLLFSNIAKIILGLNLLPAPNGSRYPPRSALMRADGLHRFTEHVLQDRGSGFSIAHL
jgi:hypothetical protein